MIVFIVFGIIFLMSIIIKIVINILFMRKTINKDIADPIVPGYINSDIPLKQALKNFDKMRQYKGNEK